MKLLTRLIILAIFIIPCIRSVGAAECSIFSVEQIDVLQNAYDFGKEHDVGWTMAAIAWKESSAGVRPVNWNDPSFGVYHVLLKNAAHNEGVDIATQPLKALSIAARLLYDHEYSAKQSLIVLEFWRGVHGNDWPKIWASYNEGYNWSGDKGRKYSNDIKKKIKYLQVNNCVVR